MTSIAIDTSVAILLLVSTHRAHSEVVDWWGARTLVALAAATHGWPLATRDARARVTYDAVGVEVQVAG